MRVSLEAACFTPQQILPEKYPEVVIAGRSNVGKSSLINALLGVKLAHVGATPGKTRSINFYLVAGECPFRVVDLPGYGYASRSKSEINEWRRLTSAYMERRHSMQLACHLVDFRHGLLANDRELQEWLTRCGKQILVVFTKADKIARGRWQGMVRQYVQDGLYSVDVPIVTSSEKRVGFDELRSFIRNFLSNAEKDWNGSNGE